MMRQQLHRLAGVFMVLMAISAPVNSTGNDQQSALYQEVSEAFIGLRVGNGGSSFYRILVNEDEDPYLDVNTFLKYILGLNSECNIDRKLCSVVLPRESSLRWLDAESLRMSNSQGDGEASLASDDVVVKDGSVWLHYQALERWLPLKAVWSLRSYEMSVNPYFKLPDEILSQRENARLRQLDNKKKRERMSSESDTTVPGSGNYFYEARAEIKATQTTGQKHGVEASYEVGADLFQGRLQAGGAYLDGDVDPVQYWRYERFDNSISEYMALGQVFYEGNLIHQSRMLEDGFKMVRYYQANGSGAFDLSATVPGEAVVDVYRNGFYEDTVVADKLGQVVLKDMQASSGEVITLRGVSKEGEEIEQRFKISGSINQYLSPNEWDYEFTGGSDDLGEIQSLSLKYGVDSNLTAGLTLNNTSNTVQEDLSALASVSYRPHHKVSMQWQKEIGNNNWAYDIDMSLWGGHDVRVFGQHLTSDSQELKMAGDSPVFNAVEHQWGTSRVQTETRIMHSEEVQSVRERLGLKIQHRWDMRLGLERSWRKDVHEVLNAWELKHVYALPKGSKVELGVSGDNYQRRWLAGLRWLGDTQAPWSNRTGDNRYSLVATIQGNESGVEPSVGLKWHHGDAISGLFEVNKNKAKAEVRWKFGFAKKTGRSLEKWHRQSWDSFGKGTVYGRLVRPGFKGMAGDPLPNTKVMFSDSQTTTDEYGYFMIEGLPVHQTIPVRVDISSLDIDLAPEKEQWRVKLRPGTVLELNPKLLWSVGIDGYVSEASYKTGLQLVFNHETQGEVAKVKVEPDRFFIAERLAPGDYSIDLIYPSAPSKRAFLSLNGTQNWVSDVEINPARTTGAP